MYKRTGISLLIYILVQSFILGQAETYTIKKTSFSSDRYNEFCPVYYKEGLVFISNRNASSFFNYSNTGNNGVFNMFYTRKTTEGEWLSPELLSKNLMTRYNDGPVSFSQGNDTIYYSRNLHVEGKLRNNANLRNKLGIFYATGDDDWENTREMRINNEWYNTTTPYLSPDGKRLYFASDDPEGYGGMDLYYIDWKGNYWSGDPVNLGPAINTKGNEAYPFINESGELLFASDGHGGLGGKDIFFSRMSGNEWLKPVHIDAPINSVDNDFGIVTDPLMNEGYFSSDRDGTVDIYHFNTMVPQIFYSNIQKENQYCFIFSDSGSVVIDRNKLEYRWNFKNGDTFIGSEVEYCFPGPGDFSIKLDIIDIATGRIFCNKLRSNISLRDIEQPYINCPYASIKGESVECDGLRSYLPGYEILEYKWNFGDGTWAEGPVVNHTYTKSGSYEINLTLGVKSISSDDIMRTGVSKNIEIFDESGGKLEFEEKQNEIISEPVSITGFPGAEVQTLFSVENNIKEGAVFRIELLSSDNRLGTDNSIFRNIPSKYTIDEHYEEETGLYTYYVEWQMELMATYPAYRELIGLGYNDIIIKSVKLENPAEKDLYNLMKIYSTSTDRFFADSYMLTSHALIMLDQVVNFMKKHKDVMIEVGVHSDSSGSYESNYNRCQTQANAIVNYLTNRGIVSDRLVARSYGESKPVAPNMFEDDKKINRRVEFRIIND